MKMVDRAVPVRRLEEWPGERQPNEGDWFKPNMVHMSYDGHAKDWWVRPKWEYIRFLAWARCDVFVAQ